MTKAITIISCNTIFMAYYIQYDCLYFYREKEQEQKKKKKILGNSTAPGSV